MREDYRRSLETAARQMILVHRADTLARLILRTILSNLKVKHAGILIFDKKRDEYVLKVSRGRSGFKIPAGFVKVKKNNPLIRYFTDKRLPFPKNIILADSIHRLAARSGEPSKKNLKNFLKDLEINLSLYQAKACIPGFYRNELVGILFLGDKKDKSRFSQDELGFLAVLASDVVMALKNTWLIEDLNRQLAINKRLFIQIVSALASSIEAKDAYTSGHTERVVQHSLLIAYNLKHVLRTKSWEKFTENLKIAALLHDIGKIGIPENILNKISSLSDEERKIIENHPSIGATILGHVEELGDVLAGVKYHHERYDGTGYPYHLKGRQIPLIAAIVCLADAFDAMTMDRPYHKALSYKDAIKEIRKNRGKQFAPSVVDAFLRAYSSDAKG